MRPTDLNQFDARRTKRQRLLNVRPDLGNAAKL